MRAAQSGTALRFNSYSEHTRLRSSRLISWMQICMHSLGRIVRGLLETSLAEAPLLDCLAITCLTGRWSENVVLSSSSSRNAQACKASPEHAIYLPRIISQQAFLLHLSPGTPDYAVTPRRRALVILEHATIDAEILDIQ